MKRHVKTLKKVEIQANIIKEQERHDGYEKIGEIFIFTHKAGT
jgi:hypothetical protein